MADLIAVDIAGRAGLAADLLVAGCFEGEAPGAAALPDDLAGRLLAAASRAGWNGGEKQWLMAGGEAGAMAVWLYGLGSREAFDSRKVRRWLARVVADAEAQCCRRLLCVVPQHAALAGQAGATLVAREVALAGYRFEHYRSTPERRKLEAVSLLPPPGEEAAWAAGVAVAAVLAAAPATCCDLGNTPPNEATPEWMAERARELAARLGMRVDVLGPGEMKERGMGGILAVGQGSASPPRLVRLDWGEGARAISLVGKGVTFDTGGISLKPAKSMADMRYDKCGACTVLGVAQAAAELGLAARFRAYLPLAENMPGGASYRPSDIVRCYNGKTVEIHNTDAEGRMILADAMSWAAEERPDTLIELSTLTGASVVALGLTGAGLYTPDDGLAAELLTSAERAGERLWRMPLWSEFTEELKGAHADLRNVGGRWGGANTAAAFLAHFADGAARWAHLDIAGPAAIGFDDVGTAGATGYGVATTVDWLLATSRRDRGGR